MDFNTIRSTFLERVRTKKATLADFIVNAIANADRHAESEGEANYLTTKAVLRAVTPLKNTNKLEKNANNDPFFALHNVLRFLRAGMFPTHWLTLEKEDKIKIANSAARLMDATHRHYVYIFVRQDICAEQQAVQAAHATFVAGANIAKDLDGNAKRPRKFDPTNTHFVLIGVPDLNALYLARGIAHAAEIETHEFYEEDMGDQLTAFTTGIVTQEKRATFKQFGLLKFNKEA